MELPSEGPCSKLKPMVETLVIIESLVKLIGASGLNLIVAPTPVTEAADSP